MGLDISISIVVGFKVSYSQHTENITKFDENTGKAYIKQQTKIRCSHECPESLEKFSAFYCYDGDEKEGSMAILGEKILYTKSHRIGNMEETIADIDPVLILKKIEAMKLIYPNEDIRCFAVPNVSY